MNLEQLNLRALSAAGRAQITVESPLGELRFEGGRERLVQPANGPPATAARVLQTTYRVVMRAGPAGDEHAFSPQDFVLLATVLEKTLSETSPRPAFGCCVDANIPLGAPGSSLLQHARHPLFAAREPYMTLSGRKSRSVFCARCDGVFVGWDG